MIGSNLCETLVIILRRIAFLAEWFVNVLILHLVNDVIFLKEAFLLNIVNL